MIRERQERMIQYKPVLNEIREISKDAVLVAVSKTHPYDAVLEAYEDGARVFGENRVQEAMQKFPDDRPEDMKIYLIGQLQSNKVKKAVAFFDRIESVDSIPLLLKIEKEAALIDKRIDILFEFNSSGENQKSGFRTEDDVLEALSISMEMKHVNLLGLMTVGPLGGDPDKNHKAFSRCRALFDRMNALYPVSVLSMGMSGDWRDAIEEGSNEVRIGTAIFGARG